MSSRALLRASMALAVVGFLGQADVLGQSYFPHAQGNPPPTRYSGALPFQSSQFGGRSRVSPPTTVLSTQRYASQQYVPQQYAPQQYAPQQYAPRQDSMRYPGLASPVVATTAARLPPVQNSRSQPAMQAGWTMAAGYGASTVAPGGFCGGGSCASGICGTYSQPFADYSTCNGYGYEAQKASQGFWYAGGRGLYMTRDRSDNVWLSLDSDNLPNHLLDTHDASMDWERGLEGYVGRAFDCGRSALEGRYWGVYSDVQEASVLQTAAAGNFDTPIDFTPLVYDNGGGGGPEPVANFFLNAEIHRVQRSFEVQNVEINFLRLIGGAPCRSACGSSCGVGNCGVGNCGGGNCGGGCGSCDWGAPVARPLQVRWVAGLRYFRFDEGFQFATDRGSIVFGDDPLEELYYEIDVANHLLGFQLGGRFDYASCGRWSLHGDTKLGVYGNHITHQQFLGCDVNTPATIDDVGGPFHAASYNISSSKNDASMIAEFDFGCDVAISRCWSAGFGYRLVGATGIALTTAQIPRYFEDLGEARRIDSTGSLLMHGGYAQIEFVR